MFMIKNLIVKQQTGKVKKWLSSKDEQSEANDAIVDAES